MAIETPHMGRSSARDVVFIHIVTPRAAMGEAIHSALGELSSALRAANVAPTGPWFAFHHRRPTDTFDFDACFPIAKPSTLSGRLQSRHMPELEVVRTAYHGPYEGLPSAWNDFHQWTEAQGHKITDEAVEQYSIGPSNNPDPQSWQTDLMFVLAEGEVTKERVA